MAMSTAQRPGCSHGFASTLPIATRNWRVLRLAKGATSLNLCVRPSEQSYAWKTLQMPTVSVKPELTTAPTGARACHSAFVVDENPLLMRFQSEPSVTLRAVQKAGAAVESFYRAYFVFHGLDVGNPDHLFKYLPLHCFVESLIYQLDQDNEDKLSAGAPVDDGAPSEFEGDPLKMREIKSLLKDHGLLTPTVESELNDGLEYLRLETKICKSMALGKTITREDVFMANRLKSCDYRILNFLLYAMTKGTVVEAHIEFLAAFEILLNTLDDLLDYEEDVLNNSFNTLRSLVYLYGPTEGSAELVRFISAVETKYQRLLQTLEPKMAQTSERRWEQMWEGARVKGIVRSKAGVWTIPPVIVDEAAFRAAAAAL